MSRDKLFLLVLGGGLALIVLFGVGTVILALATDSTNEQIANRIVAAFQGMFGALIAFALGYLVGHSNNGNGKKEEA